jgi:predicted metal-dependent enzyme (double-stranded beta helix superfamily)
MFDVDHFVAECVACIEEPEPRKAVRELLTRTMRTPDPVADRLRPERAGITLLHNTDDLTVIDVVWAPGMSLFPHEHRMWAAIAIYTGIEDNAFFRRPPDGAPGLVESGGKRIEQSDVTMLGADTIHSVSNPASKPTGAIHVYGGDFVNRPRSQWRPPDFVEEPYDMRVVAEQFANANSQWDAARAAEA